jgi:uncharacterized protein (UPF0371 family)
MIAMYGSQDTIPYTQQGFDNSKYLKIQRHAIVDRIDRFADGRLYLEIGGGKILHDPHAARVLPGFKTDNKKTIIRKLAHISEIIFCANAKDLVSNRQLSSFEEDYAEAVIRKLMELEKPLKTKPHVSLTLCSENSKNTEDEFIDRLKKLGYQVAKKFMIKGYPQDIDTVVSENGYGKDEYLELSKPLIIVTGAASNSGKLGTALSQLYLDHQKNIKSGFAKFELFPIWSLPLEHPVNLAYEAATADIGDFNQIDTHHLKAYDKRAVNYNRDVEAFPIIKGLADKIVAEDSAMREYNSPTDMGINLLGKAITHDEIVCVAALREIRRRANWYSEIVARDNNADGKVWIDKCLSLEKRAKRYIKNQGYNAEILL